MFEHTITYASVKYREGATTGVIRKRQEPPTVPISESLWENPGFEEVFDQMAEDGWELVSVQPLLQGAYYWDKGVESGYGFGYSLTAGYYFFWKRPA